MTLNEQTALLELEQAVEKVRRAVDDATFDYAESTECAQWIPADGYEKPMDGEIVLVYVGNGCFYCQTYMAEYGFTSQVTHWMRVTPPQDYGSTGN